jgi:hypothetical protein
VVLVKKGSNDWSPGYYKRQSAFMKYSDSGDMYDLGRGILRLVELNRRKLVL